MKFPVLNAIIKDFKQTWRHLFLTDIAYKAVAFMILTPIAGVLFRILLRLSGRNILADQDILFFFLSPVGWICFIALGAVIVGIMALEQTALFWILYENAQGKKGTVASVLGLAKQKSKPVLGATARIFCISLLVLIPFFAVGGIVFITQLSQYDINYYLKEKPPEFIFSICVAAFLGAVLAFIFLRLATAWLFALPLIVIEDFEAKKALQISKERVAGNRKLIMIWIAAWLFASSALSGILSISIGFVGKLIVPQATASLGHMVIAVGFTLLMLGAVNVIISIFWSTTFATLLFNLYKQYGCSGKIDFSSLKTFSENSNLAGFKLTRSKIVFGCIAGILVAAVVGGASLKTLQVEDKTEITAHRGSSFAAPENTMAAVKQAIADRSDWVEIDVQEIADGEIVVFHDKDFMKLAGVDLKISESTMKELNAIDIGSWFDAKFKDERVPTLDAVLKECKGKIPVNIELKPNKSDKRLVESVVGIVDSHQMESQVVVMSLDSRAVEKVKQLRPHWTIGQLASVPISDLTRLNVDFLAVNANTATRSFIKRAHAKGKQVYVWTVNDASTMSAMISRGVDNLITDKPDLARTVLEQRAELSAPERLLLEFSAILGIKREFGEI